MSATSEVQICSNALLLLGQNPISSFDDEGDSALLASNLWPTVRDAVLRSHPWNCAMKRVVLSPDLTPPAFDWSYAFTLPGDYLRVWSIGRDFDNPKFFVENGKILIDDAICNLRYIFQQIDITKYDSLLILAMTSGMAAVLAYPITKSQTEQDAMMKLHQFHLKQARTADGQEGTGEESTDSPLIQVRGT
jgi:hypothetical protein